MRWSPADDASIGVGRAGRRIDEPARDGGHVEVEPAVGVPVDLLQIAAMPPARSTSSRCTSGGLGDTLQILGVAAESRFSRSSLNGIPAESRHGPASAGLC